jgi:hypothetical protein
MPRPSVKSHVKTLVPEPGVRRVYAVAAVANAMGFGLIFTSMTLYFTRVLHLSTGEVGLGLTIAGLVGMLGGMPIGDLADRRGPREVVRAVLVVQFFVTISWVFIHGFVAFLIVASVEVLCFEAHGAANAPLVRRVGGENAAGFRSATRALGNIGTSLGAVGAGVAVAIGTPLAFHTIIVVNAVSFIVTALILGRLPRYEPLPKPEPRADAEKGSRWIALKDKPFVAYALVAGAISMQYWVVTDPLPLWVVGHTHAPRWSVPMYLVINTALVALFQVRFGKDVETLRQGGVALRRGGLFFLLSCTAIGLAAGLPAWAALLVLVGAITLHTAGEIWSSSGSFALDFGLAPDHAQGQYQGLAGIGSSLGSASAPVLMIGLVLSLGRPGWIGLGMSFALVGLAGPAVARWGERTRPAAEPDSAPAAEPAAELV